MDSRDTCTIWQIKERIHLADTCTRRLTYTFINPSATLQLPAFISTATLLLLSWPVPGTYLHGREGRRPRGRRRTEAARTEDGCAYNDRRTPRGRRRRQEDGAAMTTAARGTDSISSARRPNGAAIYMTSDDNWDAREGVRNFPRLRGRRGGAGFLARWQVEDCAQICACVTPG
jgi:hypothetical protein